MPAPKTPNTAAAAAARRRIGLETAARKLRAAGWKVQPPGPDTYQTAVEWLLNQQYPSELARFWAIAEGAVPDGEVDQLTDEEIHERRQVTNGDRPDEGSSNDNH